MPLTEFADEYHQKMFPGYVSKFPTTDPGFISVLDNFNFDRVIRTSTEGSEGLDERMGNLATLACLIGMRAHDEFKGMLAAAWNLGVSAVDIKELVYQAVPVVGMGNVFPDIKAVNEFLCDRGVTLPIPEKVVADENTRAELGSSVMRKIFDENAAEYVLNGAEETRPIREFYVENGIGEYMTRGHFSYAEREMMIFCILVGFGADREMMLRHIKANIRLGNSKKKMVNLLCRCAQFSGYVLLMQAAKCLDEVEE